MKSQPRPSAAMVDRIVSAAAAVRDIDRKALAKLARNNLSGTPFAFPTLMRFWETYRRLLEKGKIEKNTNLERALRVKDVRTDSGVAPITVLTKPYPCPGRCVYCPTDARMPKSYIPGEPAAARALSLKFDPFKQVTQRVQALERNGHEAKKIELIIKGGTWSAYRWEYRKRFIKRCFEAANRIKSGSKRSYTLDAAQKTNEKAAYRIIGLTVETRPDWVNAKEIFRLREIGCTRIELGVQSLNDDVLKMNKRGHTADDVARATALLKQAGFKVDYHLMPGLPGSTPETDLEDIKRVFGEPSFRPDMIKLYPCVVMPGSELEAWAERGEFTPLQGDALRDLLIDLKTLVPRYCRISRMIRDFPSQDIAYGNKKSNLRDEIATEMKRRGLSCLCLRCREVGHVRDFDPEAVTAKLFEEGYENAGGQEIFLSMEDPERKAVFAFLRLRLPEASSKNDAFPVLDHAAIVRELHTYGTSLDLNQKRRDASQHRGYGKRLMQEAEKIAKREGYAKMAVISGIGVREYYRLLGYRLKQTYMVKDLA